MGFKNHAISNYYLFDIPVENLFIAEYMPSAPGDYVKVYLAGLSCASLGLNDSCADIARKLNCSSAQVDEAWAYWEAQGAVRRVYANREDRSLYDVEFISLREAAFGTRTSTSPAPSRTVNLDDSSLAQLYKDVEAACGRLLESGEPVEIASWIKDYSIDPDVILLCYQYCTRKGRSNRFKYVGFILKDWKAKGLDTVSDVEEHLGNLDRHYSLYRSVFRQMGFHRNPTEAEKKLMDGWFDDMGFTIDRVFEACDKTAGIANPNLNYVNSVLRGWYDEEHGTKKEETTEKNLFAAVEELYKTDRENNEKKTEALRREIYTRIPRVETIVKELRDSNFKLSKLVLAGNRKGLEEERRNAAKLLEEKKALLACAGYPEDATNNIYTCRECKDTGILESGERCSCYNEKLQRVRLQSKENR